MKKSTEYSLQIDPVFMQLMANEKKPEVKPSVQEDYAAKQARIMALQSPSTRRNLERPKEKDAEWQSRPIPTKAECQVAASAEEMAKYERRITPKEFTTFEATRRSPKNSKGASQRSAFSEERKQAAASAFTCSPAAELSEQDKARVVEISGYAPLPPLPQKKPSWFSKLFRKKDTITVTVTKGNWGWINGWIFGNRDP